MKLQNLRRDFEITMMKNSESVQEYLTKFSTILSQMRSFGEKSSSRIVAAKILRSLTPRFDHVVVSMEESKDLTNFSFDKLMGSLQAHEAHEVRINRSVAGRRKCLSHEGGSSTKEISNDEEEQYAVRGRGR